VQFKRIKDEAAAVGHRVRKGAYDETIKMARGMFDLPKNLPMKGKCRAHLQKGRKLLVAHQGKVSPMSWVEAHLIDVIMTMALMR